LLPSKDAKVELGLRRWSFEETKSYEFIKGKSTYFNDLKAVKTNPNLNKEPVHVNAD